MAASPSIPIRMPTFSIADLEFLPFKLDLVTRRVLWLRLTAAQRRGAAFLDERALEKDVGGGWLPLESLLANEAKPAPGSDAIFHIGHCGSTLLSRLLESWEQVQALREPLPLRTLAEAWPLLSRAQSRLSPVEASALLQAFWSRCSQPLPPATRTVVKATSSCNVLIEPLLTQVPAARVVLLDQPLETHLATLLKAPASVLDAAHAAPERLSDLQSRGFAEGVTLHSLSLPEQCAMGWLAERVRFNSLSHDGRVLRVDFEDLLNQSLPTLHAIAAHFRLEAEGVLAAMASAAWGRYSKAQNHDYSRCDRAHDIALAAHQHREDIAVGAAWVARLLRRYPVLSELVTSQRSGLGIRPHPEEVGAQRFQ